MRRKVLALFCAATFTAGCTSLLGDFNTGPAQSDASGDSASAPDSETTGDVGAKGEGGEKGDGGEKREGGRDASDAGDAGVEPTAVATGATVWVTELATVSGAMSHAPSGALSYSWEVSNVPTGSVIKTASLSSHTSITASFTPDVAGNYTLKLTVTDGKNTSTAEATVIAVAPQVFYSKSTALTSAGLSDEGDGGGGSYAFWVGDFDGVDNHAVTCASTLLNSGSLPASWPIFSANFLDFWEGEAGAPYVFAGFSVEVFDAGPDAEATNFRSRLYAGTNASSCTSSPPVDLGPWAAGGTVSFAYGPRLNATGTRIAFPGDDLNIHTVAVSGLPTTLVDSYFANGTGTVAEFETPSLGPAFVPRPGWFGTSVAWARPTSATAWQVVTAPDMASGPISVYMNCAGITPREVQILSDGNVVAAYRESTSAPLNLRLFKTDSAQNCTLIRTFSSLSNSSAATATGFSISPDETTVAFSQYDPAVDDASLEDDISVGFIYVAPIDGSSPPTRISNDPSIYGPRWIAGGHLLAFTKLDSTASADANAATQLSIVVISPESGTETVVENSDGVSSIVTLSSALSCSSSSRPAGAGALATLSLVLAARLARRRRRRS
jgi:hypothetical protein